MPLNPFSRPDDPHALAVSMTGVKLGDRFVQVGCAHGGRLAGIAAKVGLSGLAVAVVPDERSATRARKGAAEGGVLLEIKTAPATRLPLEDASFDLAVVDDTAGLIGQMRTDERKEALRELIRVLRPGGRAMILGTSPRGGGLVALFSRAPPEPGFTASGDATRALQAIGFASVRTLAERDGLVFVEGIKPRTFVPKGTANANERVDG